jgi:hypothetical protein
VGARNVSGALAMYPQLEHRAMRLLVGMSLTALDVPSEFHPARMYFAGREAMAEILGHRLPALPDTSDAARKKRHSVHEQVRRAINELVEAGAITRVGGGYAGTNAVYELNVSTVPVDDVARETHREGGSETHPEGGP